MPTTDVNVIEVDASADEVWAVLADLPATRMWLPGVVSARVDGAVRVCTMADGQEIHERISDVSAERRSFRFDHLKVALPVRESGGTFTVTSAPDTGATVTLRTSFEPLDPTATEQLTGMIHAAFQQSLESLRRFIEEKRTWDAT